MCSLTVIMYSDMHAYLTPRQATKQVHTTTCTNLVVSESRRRAMRWKSILCKCDILFL